MDHDSYQFLYICIYHDLGNGKYVVNLNQFMLAIQIEYFVA